MSWPTISVLNFVPGLNDSTAQRAIRAVNRQVEDDFAPVWGAGRTLVLHASDFDGQNDPTEEPVKGDSAMYLVDESTVAGALGYHDLNGQGVPLGFVFVTNTGNDDWTVTLSHEVLELIVDPGANVLVPGPDPRPGQQNKYVLHAYEVCDAVERFAYEIDEILVSDFVTPAYFTVGDEPGTRNDFLGVGVPSFGAMPGCHLGFIDLTANKWITFTKRGAGPRGPAATRYKEYKKDRALNPDARKQAKKTYDVHVKKGKGKPQTASTGGLFRRDRKQAFFDRWTTKI